MLTRRLALKKETLAALTSEDMAAVGGGADASAATCVSCDVVCILTPAVAASMLSPTQCCHGIPTFHRAAC
jgi:hypothetical protein